MDHISTITRPSQTWLRQVLIIALCPLSALPVLAVRPVLASGCCYELVPEANYTVWPCILECSFGTCFHGVALCVEPSFDLSSVLAKIANVPSPGSAGPCISEPVIPSASHSAIASATTGASIRLGSAIKVPALGGPLHWLQIALKATLSAVNLKSRVGISSYGSQAICPLLTVPHQRSL